MILHFQEYAQNDHLGIPAVIFKNTGGHCSSPIGLRDRSPALPVIADFFDLTSLRRNLAWKKS
ncbi:hypothetical protein [Desulfospira joergensenii]|uniref:hypothetical protein n=1 Tax=Desulfospira joergensenii TaxID=53329 RepID=UPI0012947101|nr:hypothetical protein [Desulfospira joergensenii]